MMKTTFPAGFVFGAATSAYQIEGGWNADGKGESNWDRWSHTPGKIKDGSTADTACDHYHRFREDVALMRRMGLNGYRFSIAWSRVFPNGDTKLNYRGLDFYSRLVDELLTAGIQPFTTLCHYDIPQTLEDQGGWRAREMTDRFADYASAMGQHLGDRIHHWMTINEPICIAGHYGGSKEPPGLADPQAAVQVSHHLLLAHGKAIRALKETCGSNIRVGLVCNLYPVHGYSGQGQGRSNRVIAKRVGLESGLESTSGGSSVAENAAAAHLFDGYVNRWYLDPIYKGSYPTDIWEHRGQCIPQVAEGDMEIIATSPDFLGVNYYHRAVVRAVHEAGRLNYAVVSPAELGRPFTTMGWEIYPQGLYELLIRLKADYGDPEIYITENGAAFADGEPVDGRVHDPERVAYLQTHLKQVAKCIADGVRLRGYFVWSLMDNFEWELGYTQRFGLIHVDFNTLKRTIKDSGRWYAEFIASNKLDESERRI